MHDFEKIPRRRFDNINSPMSELDFPLYRMMFLEEQFKVADKYKNKTKYRHMKFHFHSVLGKKEEVYSLIKITRVLGITKDVCSKACYKTIGFILFEQIMSHLTSLLLISL